MRQARILTLLIATALIIAGCSKSGTINTATSNAASSDNPLPPRTSGVIKISTMRDGEQGCTLHSIVAVDNKGEMIDGRADITLTSAQCQDGWYVQKKGQTYYVLCTGADPELQTSIITRVATDAEWPYASTATPTPVPTPTPTPEPSLDDIAIREAKKAWAKLWTMCGDVAVMRSDATIVERRGISFQTEPRQITEADRLNGITWQGHVAERYTVERGYVPGRGWQDWANSGSYTIPRVYVVQKHRVWEVSGNYEFIGVPNYKIKCSEVPQR
ncbi:MAG TPA: hypothetical protein VK619_12235 [Pyrinomonadaceae bacterium]|nr:hypothetical protein [Pyrinomonadaceae bacterium]